MSFGSNIKPSLLPKDKLKVLTKVFSELPYDFLWRWDVLDYPECPKNVRISTWFPQTAILGKQIDFYLNLIKKIVLIILKYLI